MSKRNSGLGWHVHHKYLVGYCYDYKKRVTFIKANKPEKEVPIRLRVMQWVKGKLPQDIIKAVDACDKAWAAYDKALDAYDKPSLEDYDKATDAYKKTCDAYDKALETLEKAIEDNIDFLEELHRKECPNCCWNGERLDFEAAHTKAEEKQ